jgi:hypothetical protein
MRDPDFRYVADFEYYLRLGLCGEFARIPKALATWRAHPGSATASSIGREKADEHIRMVEKFYSRSHLPPEVLKVRREAFSSAHYSAALDVWAARSEARQHYLKSFLYHPPIFFVRPTRLVTGLFLLLPKPLDEVLLRYVNVVYVRYDTGVRPIGAKLDRFLKRIDNG